MTDSTPWEPPLSGTEVEQVLGALDRLRWTFRFKVDGLDADGLTTRVGASSLTLGGLLKHLAVQEDYAFHVKLAGEAMPRDWADNGWDQDDDWDLAFTADDDPELNYRRYDAAVERSRAALVQAVGRGGLDQPIDRTGPEGEPVSLRRLVLDLVEEYGRHTGHADLLREAVDGRVGEDPPAGWRPQS
ncbi:mycothiol transferase [Knoellia sp. Soil729]|uniref:mycothiol transferase n=1 Tax=Knoellia sp. Soil729 TaxID=1736394 RepID=UPI0006FE7DEE|nr:DUF664 domain-containing protein [Knoellia sp. Soil729]KRE42690.1 mini-circle protein [Knoellia sp. Soil729]